jgi:hypothetical protein
METQIIIQDNKKDNRKEWKEKNRDKLALYARNYYHKRCNSDPNYKKLLCEKEKINKNKRTNQVDKKPVGRPRIYSVYDPVSESILLM